ncbi:hypothetical protein [Streptomyces sp. WAC05950]|uniref:hypothetical protein n=1 Tax=Streptomyces sp. WAC05950 TaxID=2487419 RepID=UPI0021CC5C65|nr:hypothetical protein [Streptomyces sp. WAC05950]
MSDLERYRYHVADDPEVRGTPLGRERVRGMSPPDGEEGRQEFNSAEAAARFYLAEKLAREEAPGLRHAVREDRPERVPDLALLEAPRRQPGLGTTLVRFEQTQPEFPAFGN